jgi:hypothetical protein
VIRKNCGRRSARGLSLETVFVMSPLGIGVAATRQPAGTVPPSRRRSGSCLTPLPRPAGPFVAIVGILDRRGERSGRASWQFAVVGWTLVGTIKACRKSLQAPEKFGCGGVQPAVLAAMERGGVTT